MYIFLLIFVLLIAAAALFFWPASDQKQKKEGRSNRVSLSISDEIFSGRHSSPNIAVRAGASIAILGALFLIGYGIVMIQNANASKSYPETQGKVLSSKVISQKEYNSRAGSSIRYTYKPQVEYAYQVDGMSYTNNRIMFADVSSRSADEIRKLLENFSQGAVVNVYYNPKDPQKAVLIPGGQGRKTTGFLIFGLFLLFGAIWIGFWGGAEALKRLSRM